MSQNLNVLILHADTPAGEAASKAVKQRGYNAIKINSPDSINSSKNNIIDSTNFEAVNRYAERCDSENNQISILITCPATVPAKMHKTFFSPLEDLDIKDWDEIITKNLRAPMLFCQTFGSRMRSRKKGRIIQMVSNVAIDPYDPRNFSRVRNDKKKGNASVAYCCAMAALLALSRQLAADYLNSGVLINNLVYGPLREAEPLAFLEAYKQRIPLGRIMTVSQLAAALDLLLAPESEYITGQNIICDGGVNIW